MRTDSDGAEPSFTMTFPVILITRPEFPGKGEFEDGLLVPPRVPVFPIPLEPVPLVEVPREPLVDPLDGRVARWPDAKPAARIAPMTIPRNLEEHMKLHLQPAPIIPSLRPREVG
jgi:hypothetical protein